jgi:hypothetical protein
MRSGQLGHGKFQWIALIGAMLAVAACQSSASLENKRASAQPAAPILSGDPAAFIGLGDADLSRALGEPRQVRKDEPAEIWQYSGADCVVDFYLYQGDSGHLAVDRCVRSLMQSVSASQQKSL